MKLSVMTFNLRVDYGVSDRDKWDNRVKRIAEIINRTSPLTFGTQEGLFWMLEDIKNNLKESYNWIGQDRQGDKDGEYCAIFYNNKKLILLDSGQFWLSESPEKPGSVSWESAFPRICTWGHFMSTEDTNKELIIYNTHLDHISEKAREEGIKLIINKIKNKKAEKNLPIILMGDLNSEPESSVVQFLKSKSSLVDCYNFTTEKIGASFHDFNGGDDGECIDYLFVTPEIKVIETTIKRDKINGKYPSDHYPVTAQIEV